MTTIAGRLAGATVALFFLAASSVALATPAAAAPGVAPRGGVPADVQDFTFSSFSADYYLDRDAAGHSTLKTVEKLTADFPSSDQNKGIVRIIPDFYLGSPLHTTFQSISDSKGVVKPYSVTDDGTNTTVETGTDDYVHGKVTYTLTYTQRDVAGTFSNTDDDEFYWDTNGTSWSQPFDGLTARVHIAPALVPALTGHNACYRGAQGSTDRCTITGPASPTPSTPTSTATAAAQPVVLTASTNRLEAGENMTVAIGFARGTFVGAPHQQKPTPAPETPPVPDTVWGEVTGGVLLLLGIGAIPFALIRRFATGQRDAKGRGTIVPQYDVPTGLNVLESGSLVRRDRTSVPAQIVSFAVRGKLRILDYPVTDSDAGYTLELTTVDGLDEEELQLITAFFPDRRPGATFEMVAAAVETSYITRVKEAVAVGIVRKGWRTKASSRAGFLTALALIGLLVVDVVLAVVTGGASALADLAVPVLVVAAIVAVIVAYRGYVLTPSGADQRDYLLGMRLYLTVAEEDRMRMLQSPTGAERVDYTDNRQIVKLYEKLLPFAVLFGVEDDWSTQLAVRYTDSSVTPDWYVSNGLFNAAVFAASLSSLSDAVSSSVTPIPTGTSGGGSGFGGSFGGGFSGGGGGGGGGGGR